MKPPAKKAESSETAEVDINEKTMIKIYGPQIKKWGKSILVIVDKVDKAFIPEWNIIIKDFALYDEKELDNEEMELGEAVKDISKIKWRGLDDEKVGNKTGSVSMIETNTILKDILGAIESMGKNMTSLALIARRAEKKEEKPKKKSD